MTDAAPDFGAFVPGPRLRVAPTGGGNPDWAATHNIPARSAPCVVALLAAGASVNGKTITDELAFGLEGRNTPYGTPVNPACPGRIPGGSSSGSGVAVAAGLVDFALGTDTGGSVRVPASFTGVFGFRPTHGAISLEGVVPFSPSYDTVGWFARDANVLRSVGDVLLPPAAPAGIKTLRLVRDAFALADPAVKKTLRKCCDTLGITDETTLFDGMPGDWLECYRVVQCAGIWQTLGPWITATKPRFGEAIAARFAECASITKDEIARWTPMRETFAARVRAAVDDGVALVVPTTPCIALREDAPGSDYGDFYQRALTVTSITGHAGLPQVTVPGAHVDGCPIGLSFIAGVGQDRALLDAAARWSIRLHG